jgi:hypothetical protein
MTEPITQAAAVNGAASTLTVKRLRVVPAGDQ